MKTVRCKLMGNTKLGCKMYVYLKTIEMLLSMNTLSYYLIMLGAAVISAIYENNFLDALHLLQIIIVSDRLQDILKSVRSNLNMIMAVIVLIPLFIFIFASWTFYFMPEAVFIQSLKENGCQSMTECFLVLVYYVIFTLS